ncbi:MAG: PP0621 family protein [Methylophilus sp.]|nr:PP0621 family protein [Methylophilus sp.]
MARFLLFIVLIYVFYWICKRVVTHLAQDASDKKSKGASAEKIIKCANCGTYIPESESIAINVEDANANRICKNQPCKK